MSNKALSDMQRRRNGLLVWHRFVKGHWMGRGQPGEPSYEIKRDRVDQQWRVIFNGITTIDSGVTKLAVAKNSAQRHYTKTRGTTRTKVARFWLQPTASFPEIAPQRESYIDDRSYDRDCVTYANEWRATYECAGCSDVACPQCGAEGVPCP